MPSRPSNVPAALKYFDVVLVLVAAPILLLIHVPALGYLLGAGSWVALRAVGVVVDKVASATPDASRQISYRLMFMLGRLFLLALAVIIARQSSRDDGLAAVIVIAAAFTFYLAISPLTRPSSRKR